MNLDQLNARLGPAFPLDHRPTHPIPPSFPFPGKKDKDFPDRVDPYQLGTPNDKRSDYYSESGQVAYFPDGTVPIDPGLMATAHLANYRGVIATAPRLDAYRKHANPDPSTARPAYVTAHGGPMRHVIAQVRAVNTTGNDAFVLWENGLITIAPTQTGHGAAPWPFLKLPPEKVVQDMAVTSNNELLVVALYDTVKKVGQLAVIMVEGAGIPLHTFSQMGLPNQASVSDMKLLGYVDIPMAQGLRVSAACNGHWHGPSDTNNRELGKLDLTRASDVKNLYSGAWQKTIATAGYAVVISRDSDAVCVVDLSGLFLYIRTSWLHSVHTSADTQAARSAGKWPPMLDEFDETGRPQVIRQEWFSPDEKPVSVLAGHHVDRWSKDFYKFHVGHANGRVSMWDASSIMARFPWHQRTSMGPGWMGSFYVGRNPIGLAHSRRNIGSGQAIKADGHNSHLWVACRENRKVCRVATYPDGKGEVLQTIEDSRLQDPVDVVTCVRANIVMICDFAGKQIVSFRVGSVTDISDKAAKTKPVYPLPAGKTEELTGVLPVPGHPYIITSENVN